MPVVRSAVSNLDLHISGPFSKVGYGNRLLRAHLITSTLSRQHPASELLTAILRRRNTDSSLQGAGLGLAAQTIKEDTTFSERRAESIYNVPQISHQPANDHMLEAGKVILNDIRRWL